MLAVAELQKLLTALVVANLRELVRDGVGAEGGGSERVRSGRDDLGERAAVLAGGLAVGDGDNEEGLAELLAAGGLNEEGLENLLVERGTEGGKA
jgi:hypothetical protein